MTTLHTQYDIFISYAHADDRGDDADGWVTAFVKALQAQHGRFSSEPLKVFFDTQAIRHMDDWEHRIYHGLRHSSLMLAFLSPAYFSSAYCRKECERFTDHEVDRLLHGEAIAPIYFVTAPEYENTSAVHAWIENLKRRQYFDARPWHPDGIEALRREDVRKRIEALDQDISGRLTRIVKIDDSPTTVPPHNPQFVGRSAELSWIREQLAYSRIGVVAAVQGLGGIGKSALAFEYAHAFGGEYPGGRFLVQCSGVEDLRLPLVSMAERFGVDLTEEERRSVSLAYERVVSALENRDRVLLLLDNVDKPALLAPAQTSLWPKRDRVHVLVTTRMEPVSSSAVATLSLATLQEQEAVRLLENHRLFSSEAERTAAHGIARRLGCYALAVEVAAVYLWQHPEITCTAYLHRLEAEGIDAVESAGGDPSVHLSRNPENLLSRLLAPTLTSLSREERLAIEYAALLPPDQIALPWLKALVGQRYPEMMEDVAAGYPDPWLQVERRLLGLRLLIPSDEAKIARIHRLVAAHISRNADVSAQQELDVHLTARADLIYDLPAVPELWELDALTTAVPHVLSSAGSDAVHPLVAYRDMAYASVFLSDKVGLYRSLPGAAALLESAHTILARLAASDPGNAGWQRDLSISHERIGDLAVAQGDLPSALRRFTDSLTIRERLAASDPGNAEWQRDLSISHERLGDMAVAQGDLPGALRRFTESLRIMEPLAASDPDNAGWQRHISVTHDKLGDLAVTQGDLPGALQRFTDCLTIGERLAASDPGNAQWQRDLSISHNKLGDLAVAQGDLPGALQRFTDSLNIRERLAASDPGNAQWQRDLSVSHERLGDMAVAQGDLPGALRRFTDCLIIRERLAASDPGNAQWQRDLSVSHERIGDLAVAQGDLPSALRRFTDSLRIMEPLAASDPDNAGWQRHISVTHNKLGDLAVAQGDLPDALQRFTDSHGIFERLAASDPGNAQWQRDLSISHERIGDLAVAQGDLPGALQRFTDSLNIRERLAASDPGNAQWQRDLSVSHERLGDMAVAQGDLPGALRRFTDCLIIRERLAASDPGNAQWQRDLSVSHERIGDLAVAQGDLPSALRRFTDSLRIMEPLAASDPDNAGWQRHISVTHNKLGDLAVAQGDLPDALQRFTDSHGIFERLAASDPGNAQWQRDLSVSHNRLGDMAVAQGDLPGALKRFTDCLIIRERLAASDPGNAEWQRDLMISHQRIRNLAEARGDLPGSASSVRLMREHARASEEVQRRGRGNPDRRAEVSEEQAARMRAESRPTAHPGADMELAARLTREHLEALAAWEALPWLKRIRTKRPEPPKGV